MARRVPDLPGVLAYGELREQAAARAEALALRVLADRLEHGEAVPELTSITFRAAQGMAQWPAAKARQVYAAILRIGWHLRRERDSHKVLSLWLA